MALLIMIPFLFIAALVVIILQLAKLKERVNDVDNSLLDIRKALWKLDEKLAIESYILPKKQAIEEEIPQEEQPTSSVTPSMPPATLVVPLATPIAPPAVPAMPLVAREERGESITAEVLPVVPEIETTPKEAPQEIHQEAVKKPVVPWPTRPKREANWAKQLFNESLLGKIGIVTLVAGIGFFVKYSIDQNWINEIGRVGIGILTGAIIIALAHYLHKKYRVFSAILTGGGISALYITITLAFREYQLFEQPLAFALLIAVTAFSVVLSLVYDRKELALFSLLGGYASPLMVSTGAGNYIILFSFILILNTGMLLISTRKNWTAIKVVSFIATAIFYFSWLFASFKGEYGGGAIFAFLFFVQFYLMTVFDHLQSGHKLTPLQFFFILGNNLALLTAGYTIFRHFETNYLGLITILIAAINTVAMLSLLSHKKIDKNLIYTLIAVVLSLVSLAVPIQLKGHVITLFWAAEAVILTWLWQKTRIRIFNIGLQLILPLICISWIMDVHNNYDSHGLPVVINRMFITGITVLASFITCRLMLQKEAAEKTFPRVLAVAAWVMIYFVPFLELNYHFRMVGTNILPVVLFAWTTLYLAVLTRVHHKSLSLPQTVWGVIVLAGLSALYMIFLAMSLRHEILFWNISTRWLLLHYLALPGLVYLFYFVVSNIRSSGKFVLASWITTFLGVVIILAEADITMIQLCSHGSNYPEMMHSLHTLGYPLLCGLIAMTLMIWGLQKKEIILRKISLTFFGIIILKFYLIDVWRMSPTDRILSFVVLGIILLLVYFLLQKIKGLVTDNVNKEELNQ